MQSENFDNKIRQAAEQHHPSYDEKAWSKMEKLLDRHLPQKDDRRRFIFLLLFLLLIGGGVWLLISKPWDKNDRSLSVVNVPAENETNPSTKPSAETTGGAKKGASPLVEEGRANETKAIDKVAGKAVSDKQDKTKNTNTVDAGIADPSKQKKVLYKRETKTDQLQTDIINGLATKKDKTTPSNSNTVVTSSTDSKNDKSSTSREPEKTGNDITANKTETTSKKINEPKKDDVKMNEVSEPKNNDETKASDQKEVAAGKSSSKKHNSFFFSFSTGPDVSSIGMKEPGEVKLLAGAGVGYTIKDRLTIRTGFYSVSKVYTANKSNYYPPGGIPPSPYLDKIDANCKVYEIPLNFSYNFSKSTKNSLFATAGLSSFIMKHEVYDYLYKYPGNPPTTYTYTKKIDNENKHYFSVLTLSGGYQRRINKVLSLSAEPYVKLPLAGVGYGKVKLNSAGILFSANIKPFNH